MKTPTFTIINNIPPAYMALSDAISELLYTMGSRTLCGACFRGHLGAIVHGKHDEMGQFVSQGCCGNCTNSLPTGCPQKPVGCAAYTCHGLALLIPDRINRCLARIRYLAFRAPKKERAKAKSSWGDYSPGAGCYTHTLNDVAKHKYTPAQLARFTRAANRAKRITAWLIKTEWHPNWPLVELLTKSRVQLGSPNLGQRSDS